MVVELQLQAVEPKEIARWAARREQLNEAKRLAPGPCEVDVPDVERPGVDVVAAGPCLTVEAAGAGGVEAAKGVVLVEDLPGMRDLQREDHTVGTEEASGWG